MKVANSKEFVSENIPSDCWELIFNHLNHDDLKSISLVCKDFLKSSNNLVKSIKVIHPDINLLHQHLKRFRKIKRIDFRNFQGCIDDSVRVVGLSGINVEALDICIERKLQIKLLMELSSNNLKVLNCFHTDGVNYDLSKIATCFPNLEELQIHNSDRSGLYSPSPTALVVESIASKLNALVVESIASKLKLLKKVVFDRFHDITDESLDALSLNCALLKDVTLSSIKQLTKTGIGCLLRNRYNLEALSIEFIKNASANPAITIENSIGHAKALASLKFYDMDISDNILEAIANAKLPLKEFDLDNCDGYSVSGLSKVLQYSSKHLRELNIASNDFDDADMELLFMDQVGQNITHIDIQHSSGTTVKTLLLLLTKCPSLVDLGMDLESNHSLHIEDMSKQYHNIQILSVHFWGTFRDAFVRHIGHFFPNLQVLELIDCEEVTSTAIEAVLKCCSSITTLMLVFYGRRRVIKAKLPMLNLEVLELSCSDVDNEGLAVVAKRCQRLVSLNLKCCHNVSTEGMKHIVKNIKTLTCLQLNNLSGLNYGELLEWMLLPGNTASLKRIYISGYEFDDKQRNRFLHHGCLLFSESF